MSIHFKIIFKNSDKEFILSKKPPGLNGLEYFNKLLGSGIYTKFQQTNIESNVKFCDNYCVSHELYFELDEINNNEKLQKLFSKHSVHYVFIKKDYLNDFCIISHEDRRDAFNILYVIDDEKLKQYFMDNLLDNLIK